MREREVEEYFRLAIEALGGECWKWVSPGRKGVPDRVVFLPGKPTFFVELKRPGEDLDVTQKRVHRRLKALGAVVYTVDSPEAVDALLKYWR